MNLSTLVTLSMHCCISTHTQSLTVIASAPLAIAQLTCMMHRNLVSTCYCICGLAEPQSKTCNSLYTRSILMELATTCLPGCCRLYVDPAVDSLSHLHERSKWTGPNGAQGNPTKGTDRPKYALLPPPQLTICSDTSCGNIPTAKLACLQPTSVAQLQLPST